MPTKRSLEATASRHVELAEALNVETYFLDTTCVPLNIHFPVDWVLLRDAARTLMKATMLIRKRGLKVRMEEPAEFLKRMNQLCIQMTHARRKKDGRRLRKAALRKMKKLSKIKGAHAERREDGRPRGCGVGSFCLLHSMQSASIRRVSFYGFIPKRNRLSR